MRSGRARSPSEVARTGIPRPVALLNVPIHPVRLRGLLGAVRSAVQDGIRTTVLYVNVHCMNVAAEDAGYREILRRADIVYCDGTGVRLAASALGLDLPERMTGADWIHDLCRMAVHDDLSLYFMGSEEGVAAAAARCLQREYPDLRVVGTRSGFGPDPALPAAVNAARPDVLLVGMGTPRQERWIATHRAEIDAPVVWAVGALFEFVAGTIPRGPHWMTDNGLEWLCRLVAEPRKLWRRYLIGNPKFFWRVLHERLRRYRSASLRP